MTTNTMPQIPTDRDSFDAAVVTEFTQWLREQGVTAFDELLWMIVQRMAVGSEEAAKTQREFELELREFTMALERDIHVLDLGRIAPEADGIVVDGKRYRRLNKKTSATVSLYDATGKRLHTVSLARMPESKKVSLHWQLEAELAHIIKRYPAAELVAVADAATENWRILNDIEQSLQIIFDKAVDYFHAAEHLATALKLAGLDADEIKKHKDTLRDHVDGASLALQTLVRIRNTEPYTTMSATQKKDFNAELTYFNNNADRMPYAAWQEKNQPIGSGVQEAACKSLVVWRMKGSGMSWLQAGGQAVLTLRCYRKSDRADLLWPVLTPLLRSSFEIDPSNERQKPSWSKKVA